MTDRPDTPPAASQEARVVVWGVTGLMGASLGLTLRGRTSCHVVGLGRNPRRLEQALAMGAAHEVTTDEDAALSGADLLVMATPVQTLLDHGPALMTKAPSGCLVMDVGSVKGAVAEAFSGLDTQAFFVPAHPMCGSEQAGMEGARADLYDGAVVALTPTDETNDEAVKTAAAFWTALGAEVFLMSPQVHDDGVAHVSHLPQLAAALLVLAGLTGEHTEVLAATGFDSATRLASGSPALWRQIVQHNRGPVLNALVRYAEQLTALMQTIHEGNDDALEELLLKAKTERDELLTRRTGKADAGGET